MASTDLAAKVLHAKLAQTSNQAPVLLQQGLSRHNLYPPYKPFMTWMKFRAQEDESLAALV